MAAAARAGPNPIPMTLFPEDQKFLTRLASSGFRPQVIFDIGASNGVWSDTISAIYPEASFHMFEPLAEHVEFYRADLVERLRRRPNLTLHPVALGDSDGMTRVYVAHDGFGSTILDRDDTPEVRQVVQKVVEVPKRRLDSYVERHRLPRPQIMKLDCQGAEEIILESAAECVQHAEVLLIETWLTREYGPRTPLLTEIVAWLRRRGFALVGFGEQFIDRRGCLYSVDAFFVSERALESDWTRVLRRPAGD
ncbi:MAG: FkbM family methyltransferase [Bryobacteraceae bacterium]|nr:FkbM family methyltransferase [Bryobacteraceae bacterium]